METNQTIRSEYLNAQQLENIKVLDDPQLAASLREKYADLSDTSGNDKWYAFTTQDTFKDQGGNDTVYSKVSYTLGSHLENLVLVGDGHIYGAGNNADNILIGNDGNNRLNSGRGNDIVLGGLGNDTLNGGDGNDILYGEEGHDILNGEAGNDILRGGAGDDTYLFTQAAGQDTLIDDEGSNVVKFSDGLRLSDLQSHEVVNETGGKDWVISYHGADRLSVRDDVKLTITNQISADGRDLSVERFIIEGKALTATEFARNQKLSEPLRNEQETLIDGTDGDDRLTGTSGPDIIDGKRGADTMIGLAGDDVYYVDHLGDKTVEQANGGLDTVVSSVSHTLATHIENLTLTGTNNIFGAGNNGDNTLTGNSGNNRLNSGRGHDTVYGMDGNDTLNGGDGNDYLDGGSGDDVINGDAGNDTLIGGLGKDILKGGAGHDTYVFGDNDTIIDNQGNNTLKFSDELTVDDIKLDVINNADGSQTWHITSDKGSAIIQNQQAADGSMAIDAFQFDDQVYTAAVLLERLTKSVASAAEVIRGSGVLKGTEGNDKIYGSDDNDVLDGGRGDDYLEGRLGADTYVFGRGYGKDTLFDFNFHTDEEFASYLFNANTVKFSDGLTLDDLQIRISEGYDADKVEYIPGEFEFLNRPVTDGTTWTVQIKGSDDTLTILNQDPALGAVQTFQFDSGSYSTGEVYRRLGTPDMLTAANKQPVSAVVTPDNIYIYGTDGDDYRLNDDYRLHYLTRYNDGIRHVYGGEGNDSVDLYSDDNYDVVFYGGQGNDTMEINSAKSVVFDGGTGNDTVRGSRALDFELVFREGDGHDTVLLDAPGSIHFTGGLTLDDLSFDYSRESAVITLKQSGDSVTIGNMSTMAFDYDGILMYSVQSIRFDSGEKYMLATQLPQGGAASVVTEGGGEVLHETSAVWDDPAFVDVEAGVSRLTAVTDSDIGVSDNAVYSGLHTAAVTLDDYVSHAAVV